MTDDENLWRHERMSEVKPRESKLPPAKASDAEVVRKAIADAKKALQKGDA